MCRGSQPGWQGTLFFGVCQCPGVISGEQAGVCQRTQQVVRLGEVHGSHSIFTQTLTRGEQGTFLPSTDSGLS